MISDLDFSKNNGLIVAIAQDAMTGEILMQAFANAEAVKLTQETHEAHFFSRSRGTLWHKGEESGNFLPVSEILVDCDGDSVIYKITHNPNLKACHTGERSCFHKVLLKE